MKKCAHSQRIVLFNFS